MADVKITELPSHGTLTDDDLLIIEQSNGTKKLPLGDVIPDGGTTGQLLSKHSNTDYDISWEDAPEALPQGGTTGQVLSKASNTDYDVSWENAPSSIFWGDDVSSPPASLNADLLQNHPASYFSPIGNIATIESSPATQAHAVGDFIVYNSQLYKVISAIAANDNLVVDTNIEATNVGDELENIQNKVDYYDLATGSITSIQQAWDAIPVYDRTVIGRFFSSGAWMFIAYKYSGSEYGMMLAGRYNGLLQYMYVVSGTKYVVNLYG